MKNNIDHLNDTVDELEKSLDRKLNRKLNKGLKNKLYFDKRINKYRPIFNQKMHDKYDIPARKRLKEVLGDFITEHPDKYKQDFIINSEKCKYKYLEVQVCSKWINWKYNMDTVWVYARKKVYDSDTLFITLNKSLDYGFIFDADCFKDVKPRRLKKYSREFVYDIPWKDIVKVSIDLLDKETIELY